MELTQEQKNIAKYNKFGELLVKGVAGSGKTIVGLARMRYLIEEYFNKDDKILFVTYNTSLNSYIKHLYSTIKFEDIQSQKKLSFSSLIKEPDIINIDSLMFKFRCKSHPKKEYDFHNDEKAKLAMKTAITITKKEYEKEAVLNVKYYEFLKDEIEWIRESRISSLEEYLNHSRKGRKNAKKLTKSSTTRLAIFTLFENYRRQMLREKFLDYSDSRYYANKYVSENITKEYTHIIVDEAQDLSKLHLDFLINIWDREKRHSTLTFLYDTSQTINSNSWIGNKNSFKSLGINVVGKVKTLTKSFRTTKEIHLAANNMLIKDRTIRYDKEYVIPDFKNATGIKPFYSHFDNFSEQANNTLKVIIGLKTEFKYKNKDIIIATKTKSEMNKIYNYFLNNKIDVELLSKTTEFSNNKIRITTLKTIKGFESKAVLLLSVNEGIIPRVASSKENEEEEIRSERKLLYVGMTRASTLLYISSYGKRSSLLEDIEPHLIKQVPSNFKSLKTNIYEEIEESKEKVDESRFKEINDKLCNEKKKSKELVDNYNKLALEFSLLKSDHELLKEDEKLLLQEKEAFLKNKEFSRREYEELIAENRKLKEKINRNSNRVIEMNQIETSKSLNSYKKIESRIKVNFPNSSLNLISKISSAEYNYKNLLKDDGTDYSGVYINFCSTIEILCKNHLLKYEKVSYSDNSLTLSPIISNLERLNEFNLIIKDFEKMELIKTRNDAAHGKLISLEKCRELRDFLLENNGLKNIIKALRKRIKKIEDSTSLITGNIEGGIGQKKYMKKDFYTYIINDNIFALGLKKISGYGVFKGQYKMIDGTNLFIIEEFKNN